MEETLHFWYSENQSKILRKMMRQKNYASIDGETVEYTTCHNTMDHGCRFEDIKYLGSGSYSHTSGTW